MRNLKLVHPTSWAKVLAGLIVSVIVGCNDPFREEPPPAAGTSASEEETVQLNDFLSQIDLGSGIVIVQKDGSIQDAVDAAIPGDAIYIEPGIYKEVITINKPGIRLIGLSGAANEHVILENPGNADRVLT